MGAPDGPPMRLRARGATGVARSAGVGGSHQVASRKCGREKGNKPPKHAGAAGRGRQNAASPGRRARTTLARVAPLSLAPRRRRDCRPPIA